MELALSRADKVNKLLVVDIAPVDYAEVADGHVEIIEGMKALDFEEIKSRLDAGKFLENYILDEPTRNFVLTNLIRNDQGKYSWRLNLASIENNYHRLRVNPIASTPFSKPTLFVKGSLSNYIKEQQKEEILGIFPSAQFEILMQAGHWFHADKPQNIQKVVAEFLKNGS